MNGTILTFAAFMVAIGWNGNGSKAVEEFGTDFKGFVPVIASIAGLTLLSRTRLAPVVVPFITLAVITTVVRKFPVIQEDLKQSNAILTK